MRIIACNDFQRRFKSISIAYSPHKMFNLTQAKFASNGTFVWYVNLYYGIFCNKYVGMVLTFRY